MKFTKHGNYLYRVAPKDGTYLGLVQNGLPTSQAVGMDGVQFDARRFNWLGSIAPTVETMVTWKTTGVATIAQAREKERREQEEAGEPGSRPKKRERIRPEGPW